MDVRNLTCIGCPMGCQITVNMEGSQILEVSGYTCKRGEKYARREVIAPTRTLTTTLLVEGGTAPTVSVKTKGEVPKSQLLDCVKALAGVVIPAPLHRGDVVYSNLLNTGVDLVATADVDKAD